MIFVDAGPFLARHLVRDQHHAAAVAGWGRFIADRRPLVTSNFVPDEAITLLGGPDSGGDVRGRRAAGCGGGG